VLLYKTLSTRGKSLLLSILFRRTISQLFNRNSTTPEIIKQTAERKKIKPGPGVLRIVSELSPSVGRIGAGVYGSESE
jgi:hypothetical protein